MKKIFSLVCILLIAAVLCSCGINDVPTLPDSGGDAEFFEETHTADKSGAINSERVQKETTTAEPATDENGTPLPTDPTTTATAEPTDDISIFNSKSFLLVGSMYIDADTGYVPIKIAYKTDKVSMQTQLSGISASIIISGDDGLLLFPDMKLYYDMPKFMMGEFDMSSLGSDANAEFVGETTENLNGYEVICKTFKDDTSSVKYYMSGDKMLKMTSYDEDGVTEMDLVIDDLTANPPDSYFAVPDGYEKGKASDLLDLVGGAQ